MSSIQSGQPFSAKYRTVRGAAGGMSYGKQKTETEDNAFDALAGYSNTKIALVDGRIVIVSFDDGRGCYPLPRLYGLSSTMAIKSADDTAGMFLHGHTASIGFWDPDTVYNESICEGRFDSLNFKAAEYSAKIDEHPYDLTKADVREFMNSFPERLPSKADFIQKIIAQTRDETLKNQLQSILDMKTPNYMLQILVLRSDATNPDMFLYNFCANERLYYHDLLKAGKSITVELSKPFEEAIGKSKRMNDGIIRADASNAIDPHADRKKFPVLESHLTIVRTSADKLMGKVVLKNQGDAYAKELYISYSADGRRKNPVVEKKKPHGWDSASLVCHIHGSTNVISEAAAQDQLAKVCKGDIGSDFQSIDDFRGVFVRWIHRIIGKPYWRLGSIDKLGYGAPRNSGHLRCCIWAEGSKDVISKILQIQASKHNTNLGDCDLVIHTFLQCIFGRIVKHYSNYEITNYKLGRTSNWDLDELVRYILDEPQPADLARLAARASAFGAAPATRNPSPPALIVSTVPAAAAALAPALPAPVNSISPLPPAAPTHDFKFVKMPTQMIVMEKDDEVTRIPYKGHFHLLKDYCEAQISELGPARFKEYAAQLAILNRTYAS